MIIPIRCFSCGKPIAHLWEEYKERVAKGEPIFKYGQRIGIAISDMDTGDLVHVHNLSGERGRNN